MTARAEDFGDDAFAAILRTGKAQHLEDDFVVWLGPFSAGITHINAVAEDRAIDMDQTLAVALEISADEPPWRWRTPGAIPSSRPGVFRSFAMTHRGM